MRRERPHDLLDRLTEGTGALVVLLQGNRDRLSPEEVGTSGIEVRPGPLSLGGFALRHQPAPNDRSPPGHSAFTGHESPRCG